MIRPVILPCSRIVLFSAVIIPLSGCNDLESRNRLHANAVPKALMSRCLNDRRNHLRASLDLSSEIDVLALRQTER